MAILDRTKLESRFFALSIMMGLGACGDEVSRIVTVPLRSDTYIQLGSEASHGGEEILQVVGGASPSHSLLPLPSVDGEVGEESYLEAILRSIFVDSIFSPGCDSSKILLPEYLSSVKLIVTPVASSDAASAAQFSVRAMGRGWWQGATWTRAHPFSSAGAWATPGGDLLTGSSPVVGVQSTTKITFEVKDLVTESGQNYEWGGIPAINGLRLESSSGTSVNFHSTQSAWGESYAPKMEFTYTGPCIPPDVTND